MTAKNHSLRIFAEDFRQLRGKPTKVVIDQLTAIGSAVDQRMGSHKDIAVRVPLGDGSQRLVQPVLGLLCIRHAAVDMIAVTAIQRIDSQEVIPAHDLVDAADGEVGVLFIGPVRITEDGIEALEIQFFLLGRSRLHIVVAQTEDQRDFLRVKHVLIKLFKFLRLGGGGMLEQVTGKKHGIQSVLIVLQRHIPQLLVGLCGTQLRVVGAAAMLQVGNSSKLQHDFLLVE